MKLTLNRGFIVKEIDGKAVLLSITQSAIMANKMISLNDSGLLIYKMLEKGKNEEEIVEEMVKTYKIDKKDAKNDFKAFSDSLIELGVLYSEND